MSARDVREQAEVLVRAWEGGYFDAFAERWTDVNAGFWANTPTNWPDLGGKVGREREA